MGFQTVRCGDCRLLYASPRPSDDEIDEAVQMGEHKALGLNVKSRRSEAKVAQFAPCLSRMFPDLVDRPFTWLDIGAGYGEVVEAVQSLSPNARAEGLEPMQQKAAAARSRGLNVENAYLREGHEKVDVVSVVDVFSHIADFHAFLRLVRSAVKPGGSLFLVTGNLADVERRDEFPDELGLPDHLVFAGEDHIRRYLAEAGFSIRSIERQRFDTVLHIAKSMVKKALGRPVRVGMPYGSRYRSLAIRATLD